MKCGLLGEKLGHSYSPQIHSELADYDYRLYEKKPNEVENFVRCGDWEGLNVTIPYKKTVMNYCDELSELAQAIGSVNTLRRRTDGTIFGDNTDAAGFEMMLKSVFSPLSALRGKKALVLGTGGASVAVQEILRKHEAVVVPVSRTGEINYRNIDNHADASLIVNTTPLGMFPNNGEKAVDLSVFRHLEAVLDVVYNPARTALLLQAEELDIRNSGGLRMLIGQAKRSAEIFMGNSLPDTEVDRILKKLSMSMMNIILIGMPGSGKTTISSILSDILGRPCAEADYEIEKQAGMRIPEIFRKEGESGFRDRETAVLKDLGKQSGIIISTGGGCVTREENYPLLHQNGIIIRLTRDPANLEREGRPLSVNADLKRMAEVRNPMYERFADHSISNDGTPEETVQSILEVLT